MEVKKPTARAVNKKSQKAKQTEEPVDANIVSEDKTPESKEESHQEFRKAAEDTVEKENGHIKSTADINLEENKEEQDSAKVNFMDDDYMSSLLKKKTEQSEEKNEGEEKTENTNSSENKAVPQGDPVDAGAFTKDDMQDFAEVFMDILDMGISTALKFYSKDTSTTAYELGTDKKRRLVRQLTNLFMKYQMKFSLEFMFIVTLLICYSVPIAKAKKTRKEIKEGTFKREGGKPGKG